MKGKRFNEEQIIVILKESEAGIKVSDLCRQHGISEGTYCRLNRVNRGQSPINSILLRWPYSHVSCRSQLKLSQEHIPQAAPESMNQIMDDGFQPSGAQIRNR